MRRWRHFPWRRRPWSMPVGLAVAESAESETAQSIQLAALIRFGTPLPPTCSSAAPISATIQALIGHQDVSTTMIYTHILYQGGDGVNVVDLSPSLRAGIKPAPTSIVASSRRGGVHPRPPSWDETAKSRALGDGVPSLLDDLGV
jgi:hypothetical protein